jgi:hypothetical protein
MNDHEEIKYSSALVDQEFRLTIWEQLTAENKNDSWKFMGYIEEVSNAYACCFCEKGDELSQWRAYSKKGAGYAIGFDSEKLELACKGMRHPAQLIKVTYNSQIQLKLIRQQILRFREVVSGHDIAINSKTLDSPLRHKLNPIFTKLIEYVLTFKNPAFYQEREWRAAALFSPKKEIELKFRDMQNTVVPYIEMRAQPSELNQQGRLPIVDVIKGPLVDPIIGDKSLRMLLDYYEYREVELKTSKIPIRF